MEVAARKIPNTKLSLSRANWVVSIKPWVVPAAYRSTARRHMMKKKITVRLVKMGRTFSLRCRGKLKPGFFACRITVIRVLYQ